jgi:carbonic anhydrase/acetyltransferase-like protein (isoleucine patch superfamily)
MVEPFETHQPQISPLAFVHRASVVIGEVTIGPESSIWPCATLRGDDGPITIGAQSSIQDGAVLHNTEGQSVTVVGDRVTVGHGAILHGCTVESDCVIGMGAIVLDNAHIESGCFIGAGALIPPGKRILSGSVVVGNPMRVVRQCNDKDKYFITYAVQQYVKRTRQYLKRDAGEPQR